MGIDYTQKQHEVSALVASYSERMTVFEKKREAVIAQFLEKLKEKRLAEIRKHLEAL